MVVSKEAIQKAVSIINRRINKKKDVLSDYRERFEKGEVDLKELREIEEIVREGLQDLDQLLARAKAGEKMRLNWIEVN